MRTIARHLITGGAGAIGSTLAAQLLAHGHEVVVLDDLSSGYRDLVPPDAEFIHGSVTNDDDVAAAFARKPDGVFHLAALFANQNSVDHPGLDLKVNGGGTLAILEAAVEHGARKVVNVSSSCVYGDEPVMREDELDLRPHTPYAITKLLGERYCTYFAEHHGLDVVSIRPFNVYGPNEYPGRYRNVIANFFAAAIRRDPLTITGSGEETRDFTFNRDAVAGMIAAFETATPSGSVFNIGSGTETRIGDLASLINELTGNSAGVELVRRRDWDHVDRRCADITKAREMLGYEPSTSLEAGLAATHEWLSAALV